MMRIAVTGTHGSGKTTLIDDFVEARRDYEREQEPYWALAQQGVPFSDGPTIPDLEEQLAASVKMIAGRARDADVIFDRSPLDFVAYLEVLAEGAGSEWEPTGKLLASIERALSSLDLLVFLPLSKPDEVKISIEHPRFRIHVDRRLKRIVQQDSLGLVGGLTVLNLRGTPDERLRMLLRAVGEGS